MLLFLLYLPKYSHIDDYIYIYIYIYTHACIYKNGYY